MTYSRNTYNSEIVPCGSILTANASRSELAATYKYTTVANGTDLMAEWRSWRGEYNTNYQPSNMDHWVGNCELVEYTALQFIRSGINTNGLRFKIRDCDTHIPEKNLRFLYVFNSDGDYVAFCKKVKAKYTSNLDVNSRTRNRTTFMWEIYNFSYTKLFVRDNRGEGGYYDPETGRIGRRNGGTGYHAMDNYLMTTFIPYRYFHYCADFSRWDLNRVTDSNRFAWLTPEGEDVDFRVGPYYGSPYENMTDVEYGLGSFTYTHKPTVKFMSASDSNDIIRGVAQESRSSNSRSAPAGDDYVQSHADGATAPRLRRPFNRHWSTINNEVPYVGNNERGATDAYTGKENRIVKEIYSPFLRRHYTINVTSQPTNSYGRVDCRSRNRFTNMLDRNDIPLGDLLTMLCTKISGKVKYDAHILSRVSEMNTDGGSADNLDRLISNSHFNYIPDVDDETFVLDPSDVIYMKPKKVNVASLTISDISRIGSERNRYQSVGNDRCDLDTFTIKNITIGPNNERQNNHVSYKVRHLEYHPECTERDRTSSVDHCGHYHVNDTYLDVAGEERAIELEYWNGLCENHRPTDRNFEILEVSS